MASIPRLVLIGPPGAGKTRIGKNVARILNVEFIDTDHRIVEAEGPIGEIFVRHGEEHFRAIERAVVVEALSHDAVVSLGGGAVLDAATRESLVGTRVVQLTVTAEAVARRIGGQTRPLLTGTSEGKLEAWRQLAASRRAHYDAVASCAWDTSTRPISVISQEIASWVQDDVAESETS